MSKKLAALFAGSMLLAAIGSATPVVVSGPMSQVATAPTTSCFEQLTRPVSTQATCGTCFELCASDHFCQGKHAGDRCTNTGATCQIFSGCDVFDCCRCVNGPAGLFAAAP